MQRKSSVPPAVCLGGFIALTEGGFFASTCHLVKNFGTAISKLKLQSFSFSFKFFYFIYLLNWHAVVERHTTVPSYNQDIFINRIH